MIQSLRAKDVGDDYATFLREQADSSPFHTRQWGRAIERATGHVWHLLLARDDAGTIVGALPLHHIQSRLFGNTMASTGFAVGGGILANDPTVGQQLADAGWALAQELGLSSVELRGGWLPGDAWHEKADVYAGFVRPIAASSDEELLAIPRKHRAEVRKALSNPLTVRVGTGTRDRRDHYATYAESVRNLGTPVFPKSLFHAVLDEFGDGADILTVLDHDQRPVASVLNLYWNGAIMPYWGGGTWAARALRGNELMYFKLMDHARERGMTQFDFGRSKIGTGPFSYKKNWGFTPEPLRYATRTADGTPPRDINPTSAKYRMQVDLWKKMPLPLANMLGPILSRGLG